LQPNQAGGPEQVSLMIAALIKLGFSELAAQEFTDNGITALNRPRTLSSDALVC